MILKTELLIWPMLIGHITCQREGIQENNSTDIKHTIPYIIISPVHIKSKLKIISNKSLLKTSIYYNFKLS